MTGKRKQSLAATRFLKSQVLKKTQLTAKDLMKDLVAGGTDVLIYTIRHILNTDGLTQDI